jgi:DNA-binding phage protein
MAVLFGGFTPDQLGKIVPEMQGMQADEQAKFLAATPGAAARVGRMSEVAQRKIDGALKARGFAEGGATSSTSAAKELMTKALTKPEELVTEAEVATTTEAQKKEGTMDADVGQAGDAKQATVSTAETATPVAAPEVKDAVTVSAATSEEAVDAALDKLVAATGKPSDEALAKAATMPPEQLAQLGIDAATLDEAQKVEAPDARTVQEGELIEGSTVDMDRVEGAVNYTAATGVPSSEATVQGQLTGLLEQFEGGDTPPWASGAMRAATAALASRGLGASSMAGQAVVQAAMESALPIAQADANTRAQFESQNLSNRQQAATFAAQQRANFLGIEFDQEFQTRVQNAARISDIANMNFNAEQQVALENARLAQSVDLANLSNLNAKVLSDAAAMSQLDMTNLNNRQQAQVQQANAFLQTDMANLSNEQQTAIFKAQAITNTLLSDTAAANAAAQFNASSQTQTDQFFANLTASVGQFNANQANAMSRFNAGEENAVEQFNATQKNLREQFNASNSLIVEQANAKWYQTIATTDNAATNQANRDAAAAANNMTSLAFSAAMQETRDIMSYVFQASDNDATRGVQLAIAKLSSEDAKAAAKAQKSAAMWGAIGSLAAALFR